MTLDDRLEAESASIACATHASAMPLGSPEWRRAAERGLDEYRLTKSQRQYAIELFDTFVADGFVPYW